ncbi:MAG: helix-turn-helix transcriptional regulator [Bacteroidetes bacterium]|nr:helix-turn-helix transcriptional regulator [Bacteroidota bacterium]MDA0937780.1 helix-turn-helix transcriptional regulator [Bacteroidota bacterium]MDA1344254.1 helix-turn-helix transcriptional regulator [Bacteroidota bacterium]
MIDYNQIIQRIAQIQDEKGLNAAALAQQIGVQRSSLSHLMSGRNKPSLDLLIRLHEAFPEYTIEWLIFGKKTASKEVKTSQNPDFKLSPSSNTSNAKDKFVTGTILLFSDGSFQHFSSNS